MEGRGRVFPSSLVLRPSDLLWNSHWTCVDTFLEMCLYAGYTLRVAPLRNPQDRWRGRMVYRKHLVWTRALFFIAAAILLATSQAHAIGIGCNVCRDAPAEAPSTQK